MTGRSVRWSLVAALLTAAGLASAAGAAPPADIEVRTSLDRTAVWVADRITYTITVACSNGLDILAGDLSKDKLRVDGLEILAGDVERTADRDKTAYAFRYVLTTYRVDMPELTIAPPSVRYFVRRPGQRLEDAAPAGEVQVPPSVIALRSTLPDGQPSHAIRDGGSVPPRPLRYAWLQPIGIGLVLIAIVPAAVAVIAAAQRRRPRERPRSRREVRQEEAASFETLRGLDISSVAGRREAYSQLNTLVREHLRHLAGIAARSLTPAEIEAALARREAPLPIETVTALLAACDRARYAPPEALPPVEACRQAIEQSEQLIAAR